MVDTDEWFTPLFLLTRVKEFYRGDFLDPASSELVADRVGARQYYTKENDGLIQAWKGRVWLNPPYSRLLINQFTNKLSAEYAAGHIKEALLLVNSATDTIWFQKMAQESCLRIDIKGRLRFWHPEKKSDSPKYGQSLFYFCNRDSAYKFRTNRFRFLQSFGDLGIANQIVK